MNESESPYADPALYDVVYSWYDADLAFYVDLAQRSRGPVLEVASGTGRIMIPTLEAGVDIDGFDVAPPMVARLKAKAADKGLKARAVVADMRDFTMPRRYDLITVPFRAFLHLTSTEDQIRALRCIREHLEPDGALVLNVFYPSHAYMAEHENRRTMERELVNPNTGRTVTLWTTPRYDRVNQLLVADREVIEPGDDGVPVTQHYRFTLRWIYRYEMELLLRAAGYTRWQVWGGFDRRPLEHENDEMVWTAWKN